MSRRTVSSLSTSSGCSDCPADDTEACAPCADALSDASILSLMRIVELSVTADGGEAGAEAYADLFCTDGSTQGNLGALTTGREAILAASLAVQADLQSLTITNESISRSVAADYTVTVTVLRNADLRLVSDPETPILSYGVDQFVFSPKCCLKLQAYVDLYPQA